ncbi:MAG: formylglycine-generating enzyme family protein [Candidatus Electrothrix sp. GM3_4]|nr:formylglycine-generating enzyme family protein [Candidatus Electrothrix sp. GM3_4]
MQKDNDIITPPLPDFDLLPVKGGDYLMGNDNGQDNDEKPAHPVRVAGFYMDKFQVTQRLWEAVTGDNPSNFKGERRPVETVSWKDVQSFLEKLNTRKDVRTFIRQLNPPGTKFRLLTEAEWEYAARGGIYSQNYKYAGSDRLKQVGWYNENSDKQTHEVGQLLANELGLHDMSGNVWEWCRDWFSDKYYEECHKRGVIKNPQGPTWFFPSVPALFDFSLIGEKPLYSPFQTGQARGPAPTIIMTTMPQRGYI